MILVLVYPLTAVRVQSCIIIICIRAASIKYILLLYVPYGTVASMILDAQQQKSVRVRVHDKRKRHEQLL